VNTTKIFGSLTLERVSSKERNLKDWVPEIIFAEHFDHRVNLWRAGCVVRCPTIFAEVDTNTRRLFIEKVAPILPLSLVNGTVGDNNLDLGASE
jgi:hypothetical protein